MLIHVHRPLPRYIAILERLLVCALVSSMQISSPAMARRAELKEGKEGNGEETQLTFLNFGIPSVNLIIDFL